MDYIPHLLNSNSYRNKGDLNVNRIILRDNYSDIENLTQINQEENPFLYQLFGISLATLVNDRVSKFLFEDFHCFLTTDAMNNVFASNINFVEFNPNGLMTCRMDKSSYQRSKLNICTVISNANAENIILQLNIRSHDLIDKKKNGSYSKKYLRLLSAFDQNQYGLFNLVGAIGIPLSETEQCAFKDQFLTLLHENQASSVEIVTHVPHLEINSSLSSSDITFVESSNQNSKIPLIDFKLLYSNIKSNTNAIYSNSLTTDIFDYFGRIYLNIPIDLNDYDTLNLLETNTVQREMFSIIHIKSVTNILPGRVGYELVKILRLRIASSTDTMWHACILSNLERVCKHSIKTFSRKTQLKLYVFLTGELTSNLDNDCKIILFDSNSNFHS